MLKFARSRCTAQADEPMTGHRDNRIEAARNRAAGRQVAA